MVCIVCPNGCRLKVSRDGDKIDVQGAKCKRGVAFGTPVKTSYEIPKEHLLDAMKTIRAFKLSERVNTGDVVIKDVFGADIVATADMN